MDPDKKECCRCKKELLYNEPQDKENNDLLPYKIRKVIIDPKQQVFPFFALPKDKQHIVDKKFVNYMCTECMKRA